MSGITERLLSISTEINSTRSRQEPFRFNQPEVDLDAEVSELERQKLLLATEILNHPEFHELIDEGKITYAMIRPTLTLGRGVGTDMQIYQQIVERIQRSGLSIIFAIPIEFRGDDADEFYSEVKPRLELMTLLSNEQILGDTVWNSFKNLFTSGATTVLLLFDENGSTEPENSAQEKWRQILGPTLPRSSDSGNIRADFGNRINNIAHGSDSIESVHRETRWLANQIGKLIH